MESADDDDPEPVVRAVLAHLHTCDLTEAPVGPCRGCDEHRPAFDPKIAQRASISREELYAECDRRLPALPVDDSEERTILIAREMLTVLHERYAAEEAKLAS